MRKPSDILRAMKPDTAYFSLLRFKRLHAVPHKCDDVSLIIDLVFTSNLVKNEVDYFTSESSEII